MNLNDKTKAIAESAVVTTLMVLFVVTGLYAIPMVAIFFPIPYIVIGVRHGTKYNLIAIISSSIIVGVLTNLIMGVILLLSFGFIAVSFAYMLKRKYTPSQIIMLNSGVTLVSMILSILLFDVISGTSFTSEIDNLINNMFAVDINQIASMGFGNGNIDQAKDLIEATKEVMGLLIPSFIITSSIITTYIIYWSSVAILRRFGYKHIVKPRFKLFKLPSNIIIGSLIMILGATILGYLEILYYETILLNIGFFIMFVFFLNGLAVIVHFTDRFRVHKILKGVLTLVIIVLINFLFGGFISLLGFIDAMFDFRKLRKAN